MPNIPIVTDIGKQAVVISEKQIVFTLGTGLNQLESSDFVA